jgi:hypothetical protein
MIDSISRAIAKHTPFSAKIIRAAYFKVGSFDDVIKAIEIACRMNVCLEEITTAMMVAMEPE